MLNFNRLPSKIIINGVPWTIKYLNDVHKVDSEGREPLYGQCCYLTQEIRVYKANRKRQDIWSTLWHEIIHAVLRYVRSGNYIKERDEEKFTDTFSAMINGLTQVSGNDDWQTRKEQRKK